MTGKTVKMELKPQEAALIQTIRGIRYGSVTIKIKDGLPAHGERPINDLDFSAIAREAGLTD